VLVFASHSDELIKSMCNKCVLMSHGRVVGLGETDAVIAEYHRLGAQPA